jgi:anti-sigma factor RsiW
MTRWSDEHIIAYLDGKLDMEQGQALHRARQHDPELDAYIISMELDTRELAQAVDDLPAPAPEFDFEKKKTAMAMWKQSAIAASFVGVFALGFVASRFVPTDNPPPSNWLQAVAEYQMLYSGKTLLLLEKTDDQRSREVAEIGRKLDLILARSDIDVKGLQFKRGQLLNFKNKPLVQFAYLDSDGTPIAFCIIKRGEKPDAPIATKKLLAGQNAAVWSKGKYGFVVIGKKDQKTITEIAEKLKTKMLQI